MQIKHVGSHLVLILAAVKLYSELEAENRAAMAASTRTRTWNLPNCPTSLIRIVSKSTFTFSSTSSFTFEEVYSAFAASSPALMSTELLMLVVTDVLSVLSLDLLQISSLDKLMLICSLIKILCQILQFLVASDPKKTVITMLKKIAKEIQVHV